MELSYGHSLMQQIKGHRCDSQASAVIPRVFTAFIHPLWHSWKRKKNYLCSVFNLEPGEREAQHFVISVGSQMIQLKKKKKEKGKHQRGGIAIK